MDRQSDILLESGTNELGVMEFTIGGEIFGINVAKVREIMMACEIKPMQNAHPVIEGIFKGVARALREACEIDPDAAGEIPSTKGTLGGNAP